MTAVLRKYSDVFQGILCFREKNTGKKIQVQLVKEADAKPAAQKPRPVSYNLQIRNKGVKEEIFENVPDGEVVTWCSPLVAQPKPKFTEMRSEELHVSHDYNKYRHENSKPVYEAKLVRPITKS